MLYQAEPLPDVLRQTISEGSQTSTSTLNYTRMLRRLWPCSFNSTDRAHSIARSIKSIVRTLSIQWLRFARSHEIQFGNLHKPLLLLWYWPLAFTIFVVQCSGPVEPGCPQQASNDWSRCGVSRISRHKGYSFQLRRCVTYRNV